MRDRQAAAAVASRDDGLPRRDPSLAIELEDVGKTFGEEEFVALSDVSLRVQADEFIALVGPSGCGKSTLLRLMAGLLRPTAGSVAVMGEPVTGARSDVSLMLQSPTLFEWRKVISNVLLPVEIERKPTAEDRARAAEVVQLVGLGSFSARYPRELSGGMQQRVALGRLLVTEPRLMLLDEPFGALDEFTRDKLNVEFARIAAHERHAVVLVTHSITEAVFLADRVIGMGTGPGRIVADLPVPFERPRPLEQQNTQEFQDICAEVRGYLNVS